MPTPLRTLALAIFAILLPARPIRASCCIATGFYRAFLPGSWYAVPRDHWPALLVGIPVLTFLTGRAVWLIRQLRRSQSELTRELREREVAQAQLQTAEDHNLAILAALADFMFVVSRQGVLTDYHAPIQKLLDPPPERCLGKHLRQFIPAPVAADLLAAMDRARTTSEVQVVELQLRNTTGQLIDAEARIAPSRLGECLMIVRDITQSKRADLALRQDLEIARAVADAQRELRIQLSAASNLAQAAPLCLEVAIHVAEMDSGALYLVDRSSGSLVLEAAAGLHRESIVEAGQPAPTDIARCLFSGTPTYTLCAPAACGPAPGSGLPVRALGIVPLLHEGNVIGGLALTSDTLQEVPALGRAALEAIATQMGGAIPRIQDKEALAASRHQLKALFDSLDDFLFVVDSQGIILDTNLAVAQRLGFSRQELQGRPAADLHPPEFRAQLEAMVPEMAGGGIKSFRVPMMARDGTLVPVETKLSLGIWDGQKVAIGLGRDLTERQRADQIEASLREKTALLQEIHHRIKNNLQIISSLLSLQAGQLESWQDRQPFRESQARVQAMALLHEKLYQSRDFSQIDFAEYLDVLARQILRAYCKRDKQIDLRLDLEALWLNGDAAMPCGLIVNELITNSCKYAFSGGQPGLVCLSAKRGPDHTVILQVGDNGVGLPPGIDFRKATTLGLQLVDDMVSQLNGSWIVEPSGGTLFRIVFPLGGEDQGKGGAHAESSDSGR